MKTDGNGNLVWAKTFDISTNDLIYSMDAMTNGKYAFSGSTWNSGTNNTDVFVITTDSNGDILRAKTYGGNNPEGSTCIEQTNSDGGFIITGSTQSYGAGQSDVYLIKTDSTLNSECNQADITPSVLTPSVSVGSGAIMKRGNTIGSTSTVVGATTTQMNILCCKVTAGVSPNTTICSGVGVQLQAWGGQEYGGSTGLSSTILYNPTANPPVTTTYQVIVSDECCAPDTVYVTVTVIPSPIVNLGNDTTLFQGETLLLNATNAGAGYVWQDNSGNSTYLVTAPRTYWVRVTSVNGCQKSDTINVSYSYANCDQYIFQNTLGGEHNDIKLTSDNGYILAGTALVSGNNQGSLLKIDSAGNKQWHKYYGGANSDWFESVVQTSDGGFFCTGKYSQSSASTSEDMYLLEPIIPETFGGGARRLGEPILIMVFLESKQRMDTWLWVTLIALEQDLRMYF